MYSIFIFTTSPWKLHNIIIFIFKPNFTTTNVFLLYYCCALWSYLIHFVHIGPLQYTLVLFGTHWFYFVPFNPIQSILSTSVVFGSFYPLWSYSVHISPIWSILTTLICFGPIQSILSTLVLFCPFGPLWSYLIHFDTIRSTFLSHLT